MTQNPFSRLLMSRKFWLLILDVVVSTATYFIAKYSSPEAAKDVLFVIGIWQPAFVMVIGAIAYEDKAAMQAGTALAEAEEYTKQSRIEADIVATKQAVIVAETPCP